MSWLPGPTPKMQPPLTADSARVLLTELGNRTRVHVGPVTSEVFNSWIDEIRKVSQAQEEIHSSLRLQSQSQAHTPSPTSAIWFNSLKTAPPSASPSPMFVSALNAL